jgi:hypothetical protein
MEPNKKAYLKLTAVEYIDWFPGFLKCQLIDRHGKLHEFVEKIPVICGAEANFDQASLYPVEITFTATILQEKIENGKTWFRISTEDPYQVSSEEKETEFEVWQDQLII